MEDKNIPYIVFESTQAKNERTVKRLVIALFISIVLIFASNALWLYAWCQYDYESGTETTTYTQDGGGMNIIGDNNGYGAETGNSQKGKVSSPKE